MNKDWLLIIVAGYVVYKIGWVDGFSPVNLFLLLCLAIAAGAALLRRSAYGARLRERRDEAVRKAREAEEKKAEDGEEKRD